MADAAAAKDRGNAALAAKDYDAAIAAYTEAIALDPTQHTYFSNRSAANLSKGDAAAAQADAEQCISLAPTWPKGYGRKGSALHAQKKWIEAEKAYSEGLAVAPTDAALKSGLGDVHKAKSAEQSRQNAAANPMAKAFGPDLIPRLAQHPRLSKKLGDEGFMAKLRLLQSNPQAMMASMFGDPDMQEVLSFALGIDIMSPGNGAGAFDDDEASSSAAPSKMDVEEPEEDLNAPAAALKAAKAAADVCKLAGNAHYAAKRFPEALASYDEAFRLHPDIVYKNNALAVYFEQKDYEKCILEGRAAISAGREARAPFDVLAKIYVRIGKARAKQNDLEGALQEYRTAQVENYTKDTERLIKNLELDAKKKRAADYVDLDKALEAKERGNDCFRVGDFPGAVKEYEEAIKRDPKSAPYNNNLAAALSKVGSFEAAKRACEKALELDPKYVKALAKKGDIEFLQKEYHKALDSYRTGLTLEPDNTLCKDGLRKTQVAINSSQGGDKERAAHAMADPEIQAILSDPMVRQAITDLSGADAQAGQAVMQDVVMRAKIEKLIAAGVLQTK
ncbi:hypothetical protein M885DRAFT_464465 [Pelagophyceae sp. CCMP2097]|nr:hypothetical protein M885DRAFT_464465 [Pelagophyceae sp. CCMP2097]|mmetsp:Transcript_20749/g.70304  ORF Transcript_20749/g.70304 Transcript_20749/m.70304 type:complete len:562 (+) Transcript_20749:64-1749(+)